MIKFKKYISGFLLILVLFTNTSCDLFDTRNVLKNISLNDIPEYSGTPYCEINSNEPFFIEKDITDISFEKYSPLDLLERCGTAIACVGSDIMPTEERGEIGQIKPSGWKTLKFDFVDGKFLYNRCHLIGFQLTGENANPNNLVTGTRYFNVEGMLPFENIVDDYIEDTDNHVMYRVTPVFKNDELVCRGVIMEAYSVEDGGKGVCFNVFCYNVQPGVEIDYLTGEAKAIVTPSDTKKTYVLNTNSKKIHLPECENTVNIKSENKQKVTEDIEVLLSFGYSRCGFCKP